MDYAARCEVLERELAEARERIAFLETELGSDEPVPLSFKLTGAEARLFGGLLRRPVLTKEMAMAAIYSGRTGDEAQPKIADVFVCKIRAKVKTFGIAIETLHGTGWRITPEHKNLVKAMISAEQGGLSTTAVADRRPAGAIVGKS